MTSAAARQNAKYPMVALMPISVAAAAPGNAATDNVWPANVCLRSTMYQPTTAPTIATIVPARNALTMNGKLNMSLTSSSRFHDQVACHWRFPLEITTPTQRVSSMRLPGVAIGMMCRCFWLPDDHQPTVGCAQYLDRRLVQRRQDLGGDDLRRCSAHCTTVGEVNHLIEVRQDRIHVVRDHQHGHATVDAHPANEFGDGALIRQVEAVEWLVEDEQPRIAHQRLCDQ